MCMSSLEKGLFDYCAHFLFKLFVKQLKIELPYDPKITFLGICPRELTSGSQREMFSLTLIAAAFTVATKWK